MSKSDKNQTLVQLVYVSAATVDFTESQLEQLLNRARENNSGLDVTGMLLFTENTFFQILEGEDETVQSLYDLIAKDHRHNNVLILAKQEVEERNFSDWSMGFMREKDEIAQLPGFVDFFSDQEHSNFCNLLGDNRRINQVLDGFRRGRWRRQSSQSSH